VDAVPERAVVGAKRELIFLADNPESTVSQQKIVRLPPWAQAIVTYRPAREILARLAPRLPGLRRLVRGHSSGGFQPRLPAL
jgi:hypothetical protein